MRLFLSAGEPSGDLHGANLIQSLRERYPDIEVLGFGGERMAAAGCRILYPLCNLAVMGLGGVLGSIPTFYRILGLARETLARERPDALVLIDYPGFHWWLARCGKKQGVPVSYFMPPQVWGWGTWRVHKLRRLTDQVLSGLPFEHEWFARHKVPSRYIGHPYFDEVAQQRLDGAFLAGQRYRPGTIIGILPGSRWHELRYNVPSQLKAAALIHARRPDVRFLVACLKPDHAEFVRGQLAGSPLPIEVHHGRTAEIIQLAHSCLAVSGSVSLELLSRGKPAVVVYRIFWTSRLLGKLLMRAKYITLVNLLADRLLFPEYVSSSCLAEPMARHILHWLQDRPAYEELCGQLGALRSRVGYPGACDRAAQAIGELMQTGVRRAA